MVGAGEGKLMPKPSESPGQHSSHQLFFEIGNPARTARETTRVCADRRHQGFQRGGQAAFLILGSGAHNFTGRMLVGHGLC